MGEKFNRWTKIIGERIRKTSMKKFSDETGSVVVENEKGGRKLVKGNELKKGVYEKGKPEMSLNRFENEVLRDELGMENTNRAPEDRAKVMKVMAEIHDAVIPEKPPVAQENENVPDPEEADMKAYKNFKGV